MICPICRTQNRDGRKFCTECGARLALSCPSCASPVDPGEKFCGECGSSLGVAEVAAGPATVVPTPTAERRLVSVLFADLVGFTMLSERRDPEEVRDLLTQYFDTARSLVERYGGVVEKFIGDAVMAVWGTPVAHEDDAERAVRAALEMVDAISRLGAESRAPDLRLRAGVLTGEAAVTIGAEGQGMVAGDLVNTASRLQGAAAPGTVLVGSSTYLAANRSIAFEDAGKHVLKGKELPVEAWRALRVVAGAQGFKRSDALEAPFVGRDDELRILKDLLHACARDKKPRLVSVAGIGGIGKSRLAWEFFKYIDGFVESIYWHQGRCPAYGEGVTFWALAEMVRMRARIAETEDAASSRAKLARAVEDYVADPVEQRFIEPRLAQLLGLEDGHSDREELFAAWRAFFEHIAALGPTVLVFEDLQWADHGLIDFIEHMLEWARNHPIFIIALTRPELASKRPGWGAAQRNFTSVFLEPLDEDAMRKLLAGVTERLPEQALAQILDRAEGIPLYAVEMVRMLVDTGRLVRHEALFRPAGELGHLEVPDTLHALIAARLDTLPTPDRILLQDAAVLGKTFTMSALAAVSGAEDELENRLRELVRKEILVLEADPWSPERGQYGFVQSLIREVAHGTLSRRERRERHLKAAGYFESLSDLELAGVIAAHYMDAYRASVEGLEAEELVVKARSALLDAAERAGDLGAHHQALTYIEQVLALPGGASSDEVTLWERAGDSAHAAGRYDTARTYLEKAIARHESADNHSAATRATARLGRSLVALGQVGEGIARLQAAPADLTQIGSDAEIVELTLELARSYSINVEYELSLKWADEALAAAERLELTPLIVGLLSTKGLATFHTGRPREGIALVTGAVALAEKHDLRRELLNATGQLCYILSFDDPAAGLAATRSALDMARKLGHAEEELLDAINAAELAISTGEWDWAEATLAEVARPDSPNWEKTWLAALQAVLFAFRGDAERALQHLAEGRSFQHGVDDPQTTAEFTRFEGLVALSAGDLKKAYARAMEGAERAAARDHYYFLAARSALWLRDEGLMRIALEQLEEIHSHGEWLHASTSAAAAGLAALEGRAKEADELYRSAAESYRSLRVPFDLAMSHLDHLIALGFTTPDASSISDEARAIFTELGATPFLERLEAASGQQPSNTEA